MTAPLPEGYVVHLPPQQGAPAPRHVFPADAIRKPARATCTHLPQSERTCTLCGAVKVTVHEDGGGARREWRGCETAQEQVAAELLCTGMVGAAT